MANISSLLVLLSETRVDDLRWIVFCAYLICLGVCWYTYLPLVALFGYHFWCYFGDWQNDNPIIIVESHERHVEPQTPPRSISRSSGLSSKPSTDPVNFMSYSSDEE